MLKTASAILAGALVGITAQLVWQNNHRKTPPRAESVVTIPEPANGFTIVIRK